MRIETPRLLLRDFRPSDAQALQRILGDPEVMRYIEPSFDREKTVRFINEYGLGELPSVYALEEKESGKLIGHTVFHPLSDPAIYEMGWVLGREHWHQGYAYEIGLALIRYGFETLGLAKIVAETVDPDKALKLMEKLGMHLEGVHRQEAKSPTGGRCDLYWCGILPSDLS